MCCLFHERGGTLRKSHEMRGRGGDERVRGAVSRVRVSIWGRERGQQHALIGPHLPGAEVGI